MTLNLCRFLFQRVERSVGPVCYSQSKSIYSEAFLKVDQFKRDQEFYSLKYKKTKNSFHAELVNRVKTSLEENKLDFNLTHLQDLMLLTRKSQDLELVIDATKFYLKTGHMPKNQIKGYGTMLMRLIYVLESPQIGINVVNSQDLEPIIGKCGFPFLILMNKLLEQKQYQSVVDLFDAQLPFFTEQNAKSAKSSNKLATSIPFDQAGLLVEALLYMNTKESFEKLKSVLDTFEQKNFKMSNVIFARAFLLTINQNDPQFALQFMTRFKLNNLDFSLARNLIAFDNNFLKIIALCQMNLVEDAMKLAKNLKNLVPNLTDQDNNKFVGKFFPITIKHMAEVLERSKNPEYLQELDSIKSEPNRIYHLDLKDFCKTG